MKNFLNFLIGTLSCGGVAAALPDTANVAAGASADLISTVEALVSLICGLLSTLLINWLKKKWDKKTK